MNGGAKSPFFCPRQWRTTCGRFCCNPKKMSNKSHILLISSPICSMYGTFTYIWVFFGANVGKYSIHGAYGSGKKCHLVYIFLGCPFPPRLPAKNIQGPWFPGSAPWTQIPRCWYWPGNPSRCTDVPHETAWWKVSNLEFSHVLLEIWYLEIRRFPKVGGYP